MFNRKEIQELKAGNEYLHKRIARLEEALADNSRPFCSFNNVPLHNISEHKARMDRLMRHLGLEEKTIYEHTIITKEKTK